MAKQPWRKTSDTVRSRALQDLPRGKNRRKSVGAGLAPTAGRHDRHFCESLRPRNPSLLNCLRKRHYRFHQGRSYARRNLPPSLIHLFVSHEAEEALANLFDNYTISLLLMLVLIRGKAVKLPMDDFNQRATFGRIAALF